MDPDNTNKTNAGDPYGINTSAANTVEDQLAPTIDQIAAVTQSDPVPPSPPMIPVETVSFPSHKGSLIKKIAGILAVLILLLVLSSAGAFYALAYHVVELSSNPELQKKAEFLVMELPFMPKSARYLLYKSVTADKSYTSQSFDMSAAVTTNSQTSSMLGFNNFDIAAKGDADVADKKNPLMNMNLSITKDFNVDLKAKEKFVYFKIKKLPSALLALLGLNIDNLAPLTNVWVSYDTTPLATEARDLLNQNTTEDTKSLQEDLQKELEKYMDEDVMQKIVVTKGKDESAEVYKLHLDATPDIIDSLVKKFEDGRQKNVQTDLYVMDTVTQAKKASDSIKNLTVDIWLDTESYYTRRFAMAFKLTPDSSLSTILKESPVLGESTDALSALNSAMDIAMVMKFSEFGKTVTVDVPSDVMTFEDFSKKISEVMLSMYQTKLTPAPSLSLPL